MEKFRTRTEKKLRKRNFLLVGGAVALLAVFVLVVILSLGAESGEKSGENITKTTETTPLVTESASEDETEASVKETETTVGVSLEEVSETVAQHSEKFLEILSRAGYTEEMLSGTQLITVESYGVNAVVNSFEKIDGVWTQSEVLLDKDGYVGTEGVSSDASEYASYTPKGLFPLGTGFGINPDPGTQLSYFQVTEDSYWVDDVNSEYYNQHVEGKEGKDFESAEHLIDYRGSYDYCVFVEYNTNPVVPGKGSAFFLHVGESPTAGCVAVSEAAMINTLCWLDKDCFPQILIF